MSDIAAVENARKITLINKLQQNGTFVKYAIAKPLLDQEKIPKPISRPIVTKADWRERQSNVSFAEKIAILEKMRERDAVIAKAGLRGKTPRQSRTEPSGESRA